MLKEGTFLPVPVLLKDIFASMLAQKPPPLAGPERTARGLKMETSLSCGECREPMALSTLAMMES